jgi:hypothetical protein
MDFGDAALLTVVLLGLGQQVKNLVFGTWEERKTVLLVLGTALVTVFLVAESAWGNEQIVNGRALDQLGWASLVLIAVVLSGMASTGYEALKQVGNIGQNRLTKVQTKALDIQAERLVVANQPDAGGTHPIVGDVNVAGDPSFPERGNITIIGAVCGIIALVILLVILL